MPTTIYKTKEEQKTIKRDTRGGINFCTTPKLISLDPEAENHNPLMRKSTQKQMVVLDEDQAEPFEIIETADWENLLKTITPFQQNNSKTIRNNLNDYLDKNIKHSQKSSFWEGDFFNPKGNLIQSNQASKTSPMNLQLMKDIEFKGRIGLYNSYRCKVLFERNKMSINN